VGLKSRLLVAFSLIIAVVVTVFALIAFHFATDATLNQEIEFLAHLTTEEASRLAGQLPSDDTTAWNETLKTDENADFINMIGNQDGIVASSMSQQQLSDRELSDIPYKSLIEDTRESGYFSRGDQSYIWARTAIPGTDFRLLSLHFNIDHINNSLSSLSTRLIAAALVLIWISAWIVLIFATTISRRLESQTNELEYQASHDNLTGLANRNMLLHELERAIRHSSPLRKSIALLVIDLDRFKEINDALGHQFGDLLLQEVGNRLRASLRGSDIISRLGGDEFGIIVPLAAIEDSAHVANKILDALEPSFNLSGQQLDVEASMGIALYPEHGEDAETMIRRADVAMYQAKENASGFSYYDTTRDPNTLQRLEIINELRQAIDKDQLTLHFQPKVELPMGNVCAAEALLRWEHPAKGMIAPDDFIPLAEQTGHIRQLTMWVLESAIQHCASWRESGYTIPIAINLSARNIQDNNLPPRLQAMLDQYDLEPKFITLEITETAIVKDPKRAMEILKRLNKMGIQLSIDDFGTGYTSLSYLNHLPVNEIKIDRSFVMDMLENRGNATIVHSIIELAHNMSHKVVAEGVESREIMDKLSELGCDIAQGYHISRPVSPQQFYDWLCKRMPLSS
jgi:diguanylate cyclase (GGDEF)-like protein